MSTAYSLSNMVIAVLMFARWCQENFFNYMMQHYAIDLLGGYSKEVVPDTEMVASPAWRALDQARALIRDVFISEADLVPDENTRILTVRLHNLSTRAMDEKLDLLLAVLNEAEIRYPCADLTVRYERIGK